MIFKLKIVRHKEHLAAQKPKTKLTIERVVSANAISAKKKAARKTKKVQIAETPKIKKIPAARKKQITHQATLSKVKKSITICAVGDPLPAFSLLSTDGGVVSSLSLHGTKFVIYFYPKDMTSGCATEAREFSLLSSEFAKLGYRIFGVSADSIEQHKKFISKEGITFPLLSDESKEFARLCGAHSPGSKRTTFVIDSNGIITAVYRKVVPKGHGACVYRDIQDTKTST